ncbi:MAG: energy transducer TonB [Verrucomicrobia bacterium]|nr:energy transducer TonB [Verrucomicrobiota bacterium]
MSDRKKIVLALAGSILFHVVIILLLWGVNEIWPAVPEKASANEQPTQLTMLDSPPPQEDQKQYVRTNDDQKTDQKPDNPAFESDKDTAAASELAPKGDAPLPTQEGKQQPDLGFKNEGQSLAANGQTFAPIPGEEEAVPQPPAPKQQQQQPKQESTPQPEVTSTPEATPAPEPSPVATPTPESTPTPQSTPTPTPEVASVATPSPESTSTPKEEAIPPVIDQSTPQAVAETTPLATPVPESAPTPLFTPVPEPSSTPMATPVAQASPLARPVVQATPTPELTPIVEATPAHSPVSSSSPRSTPAATPRPEPTVTELALLRPPSTPFAVPSPVATPSPAPSVPAPPVPAPTVAIRPRRTPVSHPTTVKNSTLVKKGAPPTAYRPQQRLTSLQGNISNRGRSAVAALGTPQGRFEKAVEDAVGSRWYYYVQERVDLVSVGTVQVRFNVQRNGRVEEARIIGNSSNQTLASCSLQSVLDATIPPMPEEMAPLVPPDGVEFTFSFTFD